MAKKLFVGGLPFATTKESLAEAFSRAGEVSSADIIMDRETGRSRGFGFVEMPNDEEAMAAIEMFNNKDFEGRTIFVNEARPREERPPRRDGGFRPRTGGGERRSYND